MPSEVQDERRADGLTGQAGPRAARQHRQPEIRGGGNDLGELGQVAGEGDAQGLDLVVGGVRAVQDPGQPVGSNLATDAGAQGIQYA